MRMMHSFFLFSCEKIVSCAWNIDQCTMGSHDILTLFWFLIYNLPLQYCISLYFLLPGRLKTFLWNHDITFIVYWHKKGDYYTVFHISRYPSKETNNKIALGEVGASPPWWCHALVPPGLSSWGFGLSYEVLYF